MNKIIIITFALFLVGCNTSTRDGEVIDRWLNSIGPKLPTTSSGPSAKGIVTTKSQQESGGSLYHPVSEFEYPEEGELKSSGIWTNAQSINLFRAEPTESGRETLKDPPN